MDTTPPQAPAPTPQLAPEPAQECPDLTPVLDALDLVRAAMPYRHQAVPVDQFLTGPAR